MMIVEVYCNSCKQNPCHCGEEYKFFSDVGREKLTKAINGFTTQELLEFLEEKKLLNVDAKTALHQARVNFKYGFPSYNTRK